MEILDIFCKDKVNPSTSGRRYLLNIPLPAYITGETNSFPGDMYKKKRNKSVTNSFFNDI